MKKKVLKIIIPLIILSLICFSYISKDRIKKNTTIDMIGNNDYWNAYLNMNVGYNNELVIVLTTDKFEPPSEIYVDVLAKEKNVHSSELKSKEGDNSCNPKVYKVSFDSNRYLEKNYKDVSVIIRFDNETITIPLDSVEIRN